MLHYSAVRSHQTVGDGRFSATLGAEGGTHRLGANSIDYAEAKQREGHAPACVEGKFCELRQEERFKNSPSERCAWPL